MELENEIVKLREAVARIEQKLADFKPCPMPGSCMTLEPRVRSLENAENQRRGGWYVLGIMGTACGVVGGIVSKLIK